MTAQPAIPDAADPVIATIDSAIAAYLNSIALPAALDDAIRYAVLGGGKRVRPKLAWLCCQMVGGRGAASLPAGVAVELIHAFSLVHDDLPAMDDDDLRRGRPTLHKHAGEACAILAGDAMFALAFDALAWTPPGEPASDSALHSALVRELVAGSTGMIVGQVHDTLGSFPRNLDDRKRLELIHTKKTGALIVASCRMGAIAGRATPAQLDAISRYSYPVGLQFQIVDDLLDAVGCAGHIGKATGKDTDAGKLTYPAVFGVEDSRRIARELAEQAAEALEPLGEAGQPLRAFAFELAKRVR